MLIKPFPVPSDYGFRFYDNKTFLPILKEGDDRGKEEFIPAFKLDFLLVSVKNFQLLPEENNFELQLGSGFEEIEKYFKHDKF